MSEATDAPVRPESMKRPLQGSNVWYELMTTDPNAAKAFYEKIVPGWSIGDRISGGKDYRMIGRSDGGFAGGVFGLQREELDHGVTPIWMGYIGVNDVDATVRQAEAKGGRTLMPAFDIPQGRIAMIADTQGNPIYVMTPVPPADQPDAESDVFSPTQEQRVGWNELTTADPAAAREFYRDLFGWTSEEFMPMGEFGEYRFFAHADSTIGAVCGLMPGGSSGWRYYIRVPSISTAVDAVKEGDGTISMGPHEVPGGDHIVIGNDPQGAEFALVGKA